MVVPATAGSTETRRTRCWCRAGSWRRWIELKGCAQDVRWQCISRLPIQAVLDLHWDTLHSGVLRRPDHRQHALPANAPNVRKYDTLLIGFIFRRRTVAFPRRTAVQIDVYLGQYESSYPSLSLHVRNSSVSANLNLCLNHWIGHRGFRGFNGHRPVKSDNGIRRQQGALHP